MHEQWQELIPFYITGKLSGAEAAALSTHLAQCDLCRRAVDEWKVIGQAVYDEAAVHAAGLPPLAGHVRAEAALPRADVQRWPNGRGPDPDMTRSRRAQKRRFAPFTLAATLAAVLLFGGMVLYALVTINRAPSASIVLESETPGSPTPTATPTPTPTEHSTDLGILVPQPPPVEEMPGAPTVQTPAAQATPPSPDDCTATATSGPVDVYSRPGGGDIFYSGTMNPGELWRAWTRSGDDWYQVIYEGGWGWVRGDLVTLHGRCEDLPLPSPTAAPDSPTPEIVSFAAMPAENIDRGGTVVLTWDVRGASSVSITRLSERGGLFLVPIGEDLPASGSLTYTAPPEYISTLPFVLIATTAHGGYAEEYLSLAINCPYAASLSPGQCPISQNSVEMAYQPFEGGLMIWRGDTRQIYVLFNTQSYETHNDTWQAGESLEYSQPPPAGRLQPVRGFGKVWLEWSHVRSLLGWATAAEQGYTGTVERHQHWMGRNQTTVTFFTLPDGRAVRLISDWQIVNGN